MRWPVFGIVAYVWLFLEEGTRTLLAIGQITPSFLLILMVFIGLWAPPLTAAWAAIILGLMTDLTTPIQPANYPADVALIGPACLGYLVGVYVTIQLRMMVFRDSPLAVGVLVFLAGMFAQLVIVAVLTMRGLPWLTAQPVQGWSAADQLVHRFLVLLYTAALTIPMGYLLLRLQWMFGFAPGTGKGPSYPHTRR